MHHFLCFNLKIRCWPVKEMMDWLFRSKLWELFVDDWHLCNRPTMKSALLLNGKTMYIWNLFQDKTMKSITVHLSTCFLGKPLQLNCCLWPNNFSLVLWSEKCKLLLNPVKKCMILKGESRNFERWSRLCTTLWPINWYQHVYHSVLVCL